MVWFQCEDCGENLKKPKLAGHFRSCSAYKLSCIDCGEVFTQDSVQAHTQCISEAEKYGPKGQHKASSNALAKPEKPKPNSDVDTNVGLSTRPPWFCSLCNTNTTSKQTLLLHADGKKHRAKAKAFYAAQKQSNGAEPTSNEKEASAGAPTTESTQANGVKSADDPKERDAAKGTAMMDAVEKDGVVKRKRADGTISEELDKNAKRQHLSSLNHGEVIQSENGKPECKTKSKKTVDAPSSGDDSKEAGKQKIKWKKIITKTLKNPDGVMKLKKLQKLVIKGLRESGVAEDKDQLRAMLMDKIASSSRFSVDGKRVRLMAKDDES